MAIATDEPKIIGIISFASLNKDNLNNKLVSEIITYRLDDSLKMVQLKEEIKSQKFGDLSSAIQNKVILASQLHNKEINLYDFSRGLTKKDLDYFKRLFKKMVSYGKTIKLYSMSAELFINCVDIIRLEKDGKIYESNTLFDDVISQNINTPEIVKFINCCQKNGVHLDKYTDFNELIKAIYRIKA